MHVHESEAGAFHPHPKDKTLSPVKLPATPARLPLAICRWPSLWRTGSPSLGNLPLLFLWKPNALAYGSCTCTSQKQMLFILIQRTRHSVQLDYHPCAFPSPPPPPTPAPCQLNSWNLQVTQSLIRWVSFSSTEPAIALPSEYPTPAPTDHACARVRSRCLSSSSKRLDTQWWWSVA